MIGVDVVDVKRLARAIDRVPRLEQRLFTINERRYCRDSRDAVGHFAGTFAAKEAVVKALGLTSLQQWTSRIEIVRERGGIPVALVDGVDTSLLSISISHDGGIAVAVAISEKRP